MDFNNYKFRPHSLHRLMAGVPKPLTPKQETLFIDYSKRKNGEGKPLSDNQTAVWGDLYTRKNSKCKLTDSAKSFLNELFDDFVSGIKTDLESQYLDKGILKESDAIRLLSLIEGEIFVKNNQRKENGYLSGEWDILKNKVVTDTKCKWSLDQYKKVSEKISGSAYSWQGHGYMFLTGAEKARIIHMLVNTPTELMDGELFKLDRKINFLDLEKNLRSEEFIPLLTEKVRKHIYTFKGLEKYCDESIICDISWFSEFAERPIELRYKVVEVDYCEKKISQIKEMIELAREYMNGLLDDLAAKSIKLNNVA